MRAFGLALAFLSLGLFAAFHSMWLSELRLVPGDRGDTIFFIYLLEHQWQWLVGGASAPGFWDPAVGHPMTGALGHGDIMLTFAPLYWPWRALGASPETAYELWLVAVSSLNFAAMWALLRRWLGADALAAGIGACFFAFSSARLAQIGHIQLLPQLFVLGAFASVLVLCEGLHADRRGPEGEAARARRERAAIGCYAACLVAQLWGGYYMGFFVALVTGVALVCALSMKAHRGAVLALLRERAPALATASIAGFVLVWPLATRYLHAREISHRVGVGAAEIRLPRLASYLYTGPENLLYGWMASWPPFSRIPEAHEQAIGLGLVTTGVLAFVSWRHRRRTPVRFAAVLALTLVVALTWFPFEIRLWRLWYYTLPGIGVVRAVSRIGLLLSIPAAMALAQLVSERDRGSWKKASVVLVIAMACLVEQTRQGPTFDKQRWDCEVERLEARLDLDASAFYLTGNSETNLQALAVAQRAGVPTINFVGGAFPRAWTLFEVQVMPGHTREEMLAALDGYLAAQGVAPETVQVLDPVAPGQCGG